MHFCKFNMEFLGLGYVRLGDLLEKKNTKGDDINA